jgi:hypothetical protein
VLEAAGQLPVRESARSETAADAVTYQPRLLP